MSDNKSHIVAVYTGKGVFTDRDAYKHGQPYHLNIGMAGGFIEVTKRTDGKGRAVYACIENFLTDWTSIVVLKIEK